MSLNQCQGSIVGVTHDMIVARYNSQGVLFKSNLLANRTYRIDDIVQFNAKKATTVDIEVGGTVSRMCGYEIAWLGTEIKFIKQGRTLQGEGVVLTIPDPTAQFMFVDWKYTKNPPSLGNKCTTTNVFITRASVRPEVEKLTEMFKVGQRVRFYAREQAPNDRGVCWRAAIATDEHHIITTNTNNNRTNYQVTAKNNTTTSEAMGNNRNQQKQRPLRAPAAPAPAPTPAPAPQPSSSSAATSSAPTSSEGGYQVQAPPPVAGYDYFDTSKEACAARLADFISKYRQENPTDLFSQPAFEGLLKIKYLNQLTEQLQVIRVAQEN